VSSHQLEGSSCGVAELVGQVGAVALGLLHRVLGQPRARLDGHSCLQRTLLQGSRPTRQRLLLAVLRLCAQPSQGSVHVLLVSKTPAAVWVTCWESLRSDPDRARSRSTTCAVEPLRGLVWASQCAAELLLLLLALVPVLLPLTAASSSSPLAASLPSLSLLLSSSPAPAVLCCSR